MQIKNLLTLFLSLVLLEITTLASDLKDTISFGVNSYSDNADVQVYSPELAIFKTLSSKWMIGFKMRIDSITAASIRNGSSGQTVDAVTGASANENFYDDIRYAPTLMATYEDGDDLLSFGAYYSSEIDYEGKAVFMNYVRQLNEQNTAIGVGISTSDDKWNPVFKRDLPRYNRNESKIDLSINQLISPVFSMQAVYSHMYSEGFLSSPYHFIAQGNFSKFENYPSTRSGDAFALKGVYMLNDTNSMNLSYRYYQDDWDISSHTINGELLHDFSKDFISGLRLRYYSQTKANFAKDIGSYSLTDEFFAIDYRMSAFDSYTIGIPFIYKLEDGSKVTASIDYYQTTNNEYIKTWYGIDSLSAVFTTLNYSFDY
ncbi:MAG: DUF3570 domain-containing protein [Sulfurimonas sp.]|nr:DUF3570 domain-containing protein [Sulfurimonas sp.]